MYHQCNASSAPTFTSSITFHHLHSLFQNQSHLISITVQIACYMACKVTQCSHIFLHSALPSLNFPTSFFSFPQISTVIPHIFCADLQQKEIKSAEYYTCFHFTDHKNGTKCLSTAFGATQSHSVYLNWFYLLLVLHVPNNKTELDSQAEFVKRLLCMTYAIQRVSFVFDIHQKIYRHSIGKEQNNDNLRRSTSCALAPGRVTVMVVGALMSYFLCGVRHTRSRTSSANTILAITATNGLIREGKKLQQYKIKRMHLYYAVKLDSTADKNILRNYITDY